MMAAVTHVQRVDVAGETYDIAVREEDQTHYTARSLHTQGYGSGKTQEEAIEQLERYVNDNHPHQFDLMPEKDREELLAWVKDKLMPGIRGSSERYSSYHLKHIAEKAVIGYVSNGQMKGALLAAGYEPAKGTDRSHINWDFVLRRGLAEKIEAEMARAR